MKVYLAAPYQLQDLIIARAIELRALGIEVNSRWLEETHKSTTQIKEVLHSELQFYALQDVADISEAHVFVLQPDETETIKRQGRTVELGIAIGIGLSRPLPIFIVGSGEENIFHHIPQVYHFPNWVSTKLRLLELACIEKLEKNNGGF